MQENIYSASLKAFQSLPGLVQARLINDDMAPIAYSVDEVVSSFLRKHDVFVTPVGSNISASPLTSGVMGGLGGPMAAGMNQALTAQTKGAALQEWTSWKQWALSHQDFKEYKQKAKARAEECNSRFNLWYESQEAKDIVYSFKLEQKKHTQGFLFAIIFIVVGFSIVIATSGESPKPSFELEAPANLRQ